MGRAFEPDVFMAEWVDDVERLDRDDADYLFSHLAPRSTDDRVAAFWRRMEEPEFCVVAYDTLLWARIRARERLDLYPGDSGNARYERARIHTYIDRLDASIDHLKPLRGAEVQRRNNQQQRDEAVAARQAEGLDVDHFCPWVRRFNQLRAAVLDHEQRGGSISDSAVLYQITEQLHQEGQA